MSMHSIGTIRIRVTCRRSSSTPSTRTLPEHPIVHTPERNLPLLHTQCPGLKSDTSAINSNFLVKGARAPQGRKRQRTGACSQVHAHVRFLSIPPSRHQGLWSVKSTNSKGLSDQRRKSPRAWRLQDWLQNMKLWAAIATSARGLPIHLVHPMTKGAGWPREATPASKVGERSLGGCRLKGTHNKGSIG